MVALQDVKDLKVAELREELKALGLDTSGLKPALVARLEEGLKANLTKTTTQASNPAQATITTPAAANPVAGIATADTSKAATNGRVPISYTASISNGVPKPVAAAKPAEKAESQEKPTPIQATVQSEAEKRKQRADRFGMPASQKEKLASRAERFGIAQKTDTKTTTPASEGIAPLSQADKAALEEKKKERAKRFDLPVTLSKEEIERQKKARLERFGSTSATPANGGISAVKGDDSADLQAKLAARAQRFALSGNGAQKPAETKVEEIQKPLDPIAEAKRKAREIKFVAK